MDLPQGETAASSNFKQPLIPEAADSGLHFYLVLCRTGYIAFS